MNMTCVQQGKNDRSLVITDIIKGFACTGPASIFEFVSTMNSDHKPEIEEDGVVYTQEN
jgi:hypothetical protein